MREVGALKSTFFFWGGGGGSACIATTDKDLAHHRSRSSSSGNEAPSCLLISLQNFFWNMLACSCTRRGVDENVCASRFGSYNVSFDTIRDFSGSSVVCMFVNLSSSIQSLRHAHLSAARVSRNTHHQTGDQYKRGTLHQQTRGRYCILHAALSRTCEIQACFVLFERQDQEGFSFLRDAVHHTQRRPRILFPPVLPLKIP